MSPGSLRCITNRLLVHFRDGPAGVPSLATAGWSGRSAASAAGCQANSDDVVLSDARSRLEPRPAQAVYVDRARAAVEDLLRHEQPRGRTVHEAMPAESGADGQAVDRRQPADD